MSSSPSSNPSIFASRESVYKEQPEPLGGSAPRHSSFRRQSTPHSIEKNRIEAAPGAAPLAVILPEKGFSYTDGGSEHQPRRRTKPDTTPPLWTAFQYSERAARRAKRGNSAQGRSSSIGRALITPPPPELPSATTSKSTGDKSRKRPASGAYEQRDPTSEPLSKRRKFIIETTRGKLFLDRLPPAPPTFQSDFQPPSPLFFSNNPRPRPTLPPRFSSSEAAAKMLSKTRSEDSHIKTVSLARGRVTTPIVPGTVQQPQEATARLSLERNATTWGNSPDSDDGGKDLISALNSIGIIEFLEHDDRPAFIVDLGDKDNYGSGALKPVFSNSALRACNGLEGLLYGTALEDASPGVRTTDAFFQFKSWLTSAAADGENLDVSLPPFLYANMMWSCSTLRNRLRVISGTFVATPGNRRPPVLESSTPPSITTDRPPLEAALSSGRPLYDQSDYFGNVAPLLDPLLASTGSEPHEGPAGKESAIAEAVPTIEESSSSGGTRPPATQDTTRTIINGALPTPDHDTSRAAHLLQRTPTRALSANDAVMLSEIRSPSKPYERRGGHVPSVPSDSPSFDWTRLPVSESMPEHIQFARSVDWASTSLGPIEAWGSELRQMCNLIVASPHPAAMYWGDDLIAIYNEAYIPLAGQKHPKLMGQSYREAWKEIWDEVKDVFASARTTGESTMKDDDGFFINRNNYLEEVYYSWSIIPMVGNDGSVLGLYNPAFEKTRRKIAERRMLTLREVGERAASARDVKAFWAQVLGSFEFNEQDSPFLLLYSVTDETDSDSCSIHSNSVGASRQCLLEGTLGVPEGHSAVPVQIDLKAGTSGFGPAFRDVMKTERPVVLEVGSRELPKSLVQGLGGRGFGDPVRSVVVCPILPTTGESILGFLVLGVNPRRPYDDDYALFVHLLSRQLATSLASVVLFEEEIQRGQRAAKLAALDRIALSEQLAARTQEAIESETKFTRMAEFAPVGMFIANSDGKITFANDTWYDISRVRKNRSMADTWMESVKSEDHALVEKLWEDLTVNTKPVSSEFRFKAQWRDRNGTVGDTWVLFSGYPEKYADGRLKSVFGSITNISQQKWAEGMQTRKMEEAVELKRQQENFIDITSHEMRNPLSAILQCSDEITNSLTAFRLSGERNMPDDLLTSCLDAAQIISLCSQHQKRIVDDILTLSKLDSQLLLVTPVDAQPLTVVQRALRMHEGELQAADIQMKFVVDQSYRDLTLDWVRFDPSRVLQVLINLTTNAIKFTSTESRRTISVTVSASKTRPSDTPHPPVKYVPTRRKDKDIVDAREWGEGERLYIHFAVQDTGRGLNPEEKKMLFIRFSQASARTHVQYGGSGLGLFISRELTELQGGEIGVESEAGKGSTFAFYVVARRSSAPQNTDGATGKGRLSEQERQIKIDSPNSATKLEPSLTQAANAQSNATAVAPKKTLIRRVLIVEDNLVNQRVLQKQLKNIGTEVHLANHGGEALEKLQQSTYWADMSQYPADGKRLELGVVLMDQEMPVMDGLTCTKKIRELEREGKLTGHVPIIAVTANARAEQVQTALDAGMDDVVSKPFRIPELVPKIEELTERYPPPEF